jgi:hypothetical protein
VVSAIENAASPADAINGPVEGPIPDDILAGIVAAAGTFLARKFLIRSIHEVPIPVSRWTRQGRSSVNGSHNLSSKRPVGGNVR